MRLAAGGRTGVAAGFGRAWQGATGFRLAARGSRLPAHGAYVGTWMCVIAALVVWLPVGDRLTLTRAAGAGLIGATLALLLVAYGAYSRRYLRWGIGVFLGSAALAQITLLWVISLFSGYSGKQLLDSFNLEWWAALGPFVGVPWLAGYGVGSVWLKQGRQPSKPS